MLASLSVFGAMAVLDGQALRASAAPLVLKVFVALFLAGFVYRLYRAGRTAHAGAITAIFLVVQLVGSVLGTLYILYLLYESRTWTRPVTKRTGTSKR
jgi:hypothetical protein